MDARYWSGEDDRDFDMVEDEHGPCLYCEADADEPCEASCACPQCQRAERLADRSYHPDDTWAEHRGER